MLILQRNALLRHKTEQKAEQIMS